MLLLQRAWVRSLVGELRSFMLLSVAKKKKKNPCENPKRVISALLLTEFYNGSNWNNKDGVAWKIPWTKEPSMLQSMGSLSQTWLSDFPFTFHFHALEKEMATHSGGLAWRIPGTGEPGGVPSMGSHRVRHDWSDLAAAAAGFQRFHS